MMQGRGRRKGLGFGEQKNPETREIFRELSASKLTDGKSGRFLKEEKKERGESMR